MKPGIRIILLIFLLLVCVSGPQSGVNAEELNLVNLYFFNGDGCPHCADENVFLQEMSEAYGDQLVIHSFEVWYNADNAKKFEEFAAAFEFEPTGVLRFEALPSYANRCIRFRLSLIFFSS